MKKLAYYVGLIMIALVMKNLGEKAKVVGYAEQPDMGADTEKSITTAEKNKAEYGESVEKILQNNWDEINDFYEKYPEIWQRWISFSGFDFTGDGNMEIICSYLYVETATVISYNYVYDIRGDKLFEFVSENLWDFTIYEDEDSVFYIRNQMHIAADHNVLMYEEITEDDKWNVKIAWVEWDTRDGAKILADSPDGYSVYTDFTKEEETSFMQKNFYEGMLKVFQEKEASGNIGQLKEYERIYDSLGEGKKAQVFAEMLTWEDGVQWKESKTTDTENGQAPETQKEDMAEEGEGSAGKEPAPERIYPRDGGYQGNILGYSLISNGNSNFSYRRDMPYMVEAESTGKGVFVSEYVCESGAYIGTILAELLDGYGEVQEGWRQYFTEDALRQAEETDFGLLGEGWVTNPYDYGMDFEVSRRLGETGYDFDYFFLPASESDRCASIGLSVDSSGRIYCFSAGFSDNDGFREMREFVNTANTSIDDNDYKEPLAGGKEPLSGEMLVDFEKFAKYCLHDEDYEAECGGVWLTGNVAEDADSLREVFVDILESRGENTGGYAGLFEFDSEWEAFQSIPWQQMEGGWQAAAEYDCYYTDRIVSTWYIGLQYDFYPDFEKMGTDRATAVSISCNVDVYKGLIGYTEARFYELTKEEYQNARQRKTTEEKAVMVVRKGEALSGRAQVAIPVPQTELERVALKDWQPDWDSFADENYKRQNKEELWGFSDAAEAAVFFGEKVMADYGTGTPEEPAGHVEKFLSESFGSGANYVDDIGDFVEENACRLDGQYDCYYIRENECAGCVHFRYYFYPDNTAPDAKSIRALAVDVYLSEDGIEKLWVNDLKLGRER